MGLTISSGFSSSPKTSSKESAMDLAFSKVDFIDSAACLAIFSLSTADGIGIFFIISLKLISFCNFSVNSVDVVSLFPPIASNALMSTKPRPTPVAAATGSDAKVANAPAATIAATPLNATSGSLTLSTKSPTRSASDASSYAVSSRLTAFLYIIVSSAISSL